jgi:hypothetical protein
MMPLRLRRSRAGIVILTAFFAIVTLGLVYLGRPTTITAVDGREIELQGWSFGLFVRVALALLLVVYCVKRLLSSRYIVEIDERGILDGAIKRPRIPWAKIVDLECETVGDAGSLVLTLNEPGRPKVEVDLDGVDAPRQTVFSSAQSYWTAARNAAKATEDGDRAA